jgi:tRNA(adenine34) deaminase
VSPNSDETWMQAAIAQAQCARDADEVPVGCVIVKDSELVAVGHNQPIGANDPCAHAEIVALRAAGEALGNYRLGGYQLYVTLEPCAMCATALVHARIERLVFGASDPKAGAILHHTKLYDQPYLNHRVAYEGGVLADSCAGLLKDFFRARRV